MLEQKLAQSAQPLVLRKGTMLLACPEHTSRSCRHFLEVDMDDVDAAEKLAAHQGRKSVGGIALRAVSTQVAGGPENPCETFHTAFQSKYAPPKIEHYRAPHLASAAAFCHCCATWFC